MGRPFFLRIERIIFEFKLEIFAIAIRGILHIMTLVMSVRPQANDFSGYIFQFHRAAKSSHENFGNTYLLKKVNQKAFKS
jgi:hypothetical protein